MLNRRKEAVQYYLKKEERESQAIIDDLFKSNATMEKKLDFLCVELSEKLIDDMPAHGPSWAELKKKKNEHKFDHRQSVERQNSFARILFNISEKVRSMGQTLTS